MPVKIVPLSDAAKRNIIIRREHADKLAADKIYLVCYECLIDGWTSENEVPFEPVVFYPAQQESYSVIIRRSGYEATELLRKKLSDPHKCRLLCPLHLKRAKAGWTARREEIYREWPQVANVPHPYTNEVAPGRMVDVDEYGLGPFRWPEIVAYFKALRDEWEDTTNGAPPQEM